MVERAAGENDSGRMTGCLQRMTVHVEKKLLLKNEKEFPLRVESCEERPQPASCKMW